MSSNILHNNDAKSMSNIHLLCVVDKGGERVVELGPGAGAITRELIKKYPKMVTICCCS